MRVLVVDDEYVSRTKLKALLSPCGDCDAAPSGEFGLKMFEQAHEESVPYDLVTMDIDMPGMNGRDVVQKIRQWERGQRNYQAGSEVKILMVTASTNPKDIVSSFQEGCEWYLIKPATPRNVRGAFAKLGLPPPSLSTGSRTGD